MAGLMRRVCHFTVDKSKVTHKTEVKTTVTDIGGIAENDKKSAYIG